MRGRARGWIVLLALWSGNARADPPTVTVALASDPVLVLDREVARLLRVGRPTDALPLAEESLRRREAVLASYDPNVATSLRNLAEVLLEMGQYGRTMPLLERALRLQEVALGRNDLAVATTLGSMAGVFEAMHQYERAVPVLERALHIREMALGPNGPAVADSLNSLAGVFSAMGQQGRAVSLLERALRIREAALPPNQTDVAQCLNNLAAVLCAMGQNARALPLLERALHNHEAEFGLTHPTVALSLNNLAAVFQAMGQHERAVPLLERALPIFEATFGTNHPVVAESLNGLARILLTLNQYERAAPLFERALGVRAASLQSLAQYQPESGISQFLHSLSFEADILVSLAAERPTDERFGALALQGTWLFKARAPDEASAVLTTLRQSSAPEDRALLDEWTSTQQRLAHLSSTAPMDERTRLRTSLDAVEERLTRRSNALRERHQLADVASLLPALARRLAPDAALVELVAFRPLHAHVRTDAEHWDAPHYAALILRPDGSHACVDLGEAVPIDDLAQDLRDSLTDVVREPRDTQRAGEALYQRLFASIRPLLRPATRRLLFAPDGPLNLTPLHLMHDGEAWLADRYTVSYLTSGRDLLRERSPTDQPTAPTLVAATRYADHRWNLPGVRSQVQILRRLVPGLQVLDDTAATEARLRALSAPRVLHIAAHGQFLRPRSGEANDPMQRGRLVLADADPSLTRRADGLDGLATAAELMNMNLRGTRLVVLSACDTGRGDAAVGEGVFGLRRALQFAGTEALITTLWTIDERSGTEFTVGLYEGLRSGMRSADAVARAMRLVRERHPDPFDWAPFILVGRDDVIDWVP
ncbi:MAG: hypothetical protein JWM10_4290 [Myxococcaceae bacterium]|nr:hypothetical protein [Myxococcaceae bacterium]